MSREIKFRAWDKGRKEYLSAGNVILAINPGRLPKETTFYLDILKSPNMFKERFVIQQSTGLLDENGKEIYEGDIVSAWSEGCHAIGQIKQRIDGLWIIYPAYQHRQMWGLCPNEKGETTVEIIGNTYETPELLH